MTPRQAQKTALAIVVHNWIFLLIALTMAMFFTVENMVETLDKPPDLLEKIKTIEAKTKPSKKISTNICIQLDILEKKPILRSKPPIKKKLPKPRHIQRVPFEWHSVSIHSIYKKSSVIIKDKRKNSQIYVKLNQEIPNSKYKIVQITPTKITLKMGHSIAIIKKPAIKLPK